MHSSPSKGLASKASLPLSLALGLSLAACGGGGGGGNSGSNSGTVSGSVLNSPSPVSGVELTISGPGGTFNTTTSNTGTYRIENVPPGDYSVALSGQGVFDEEGKPIPDKIDLYLPSVTIGSGENTILDKPIFLPEKAIGTEVDTSGTATGTIPAGTVITNPSAGVSIVFEELTTVTFQDPEQTSISLNRVTIDQTPVPLPAGLSGTSLVAIEPAGATFDVRPKLIFSNDTGLAGGTNGVPLYRLDFGTGQWLQFGTGTVTANGGAIVTEIGQGLEATGWHGPVVAFACTSDVSGRIENGSGTGLGGILVSTVNGASATTDASGAFTIADVPFPSAPFEVVVTVAPAANSGFLPTASSGTLGFCGETTEVGVIVLEDATMDSAEPTIVSSSPADGASDIDDAASIRVTFSEVLSPGSLNASTLTLTNAGQAIAGTIGIEEVANQTIVQFVPAAPLALASTFTLRVDANIMDAAGNALGDQAEISFTTAASGSGGTPSVAVSPNAPAGINPGSVLQFSAEVIDGSEFSVDGAQVVWSSDEPSVAVVDATGLVTALTPGLANIQASFGAQSDVVELTILSPTVSEVSLSVSNESLVAGASLTIEAQALGVDLAPLEGFSFDWSSDTPGVATVDAGGNVSAIAPGGPALITALEPVSGELATVAIVVIDPQTVSNVTVQGGAGSLGMGDSAPFSAQAFEYFGDLVPGVSFAWSSSDETVATVNANGVVTATGEGVASIMATANGSGGVMGGETVSVYNETPLVVTVHGGRYGDQPQVGVAVLRQDPVTGELLGEMTTDFDGRADFGPIDSARTTLTLILNEEGKGLSEGFVSTELLTMHNVRVGAVPIVQRPKYSFDEFYIEAYLPEGGSLKGFAFSGGYSGGSEYQSYDYSEGGSLIVDGIQVLETQPDDSASYIMSIGNSTSSTMLAAAFLLDVEVGFNGNGFFVYPTVDNVGSVPFSSSTAVSPDGGTIRRLNHLYNPSHGVGQAATSGSATIPIMPEADRFSLHFEGQPSSSGVRPFTNNVYPTLPDSVVVDMPEVTIAGLGFDIETGTIQAQIGGVDAAQMDLGELELSYLGQIGPVNWKFQFNPSLSSFTVPELMEQGQDLLPADSNFPMSLRYLGLDVVGGFDSLMQAMREYRGSVEHLRMDAAGDVAGVELALDMVNIEIADSDGVGTVVLDLGDGPFVVDGGFSGLVPIGTTVIVTATPDPDSYLEDFDTPECLPQGGSGGADTCTFVVEGAAYVYVEFRELI